ncbi:transposase [Nonomuraea basaltis]|nr:transposase [Nonomuraea basaltis]
MPSGWPDAPDRYPSDLTDAQWELIEPLLPEPNTGDVPKSIAPGERQRDPLRGAFRLSVAVLATDLPPWQTVYWYFQQWEQTGRRDRGAAGC